MPIFPGVKPPPTWLRFLSWPELDNLNDRYSDAAARLAWIYQIASPRGTGLARDPLTGAPDSFRRPGCLPALRLIPGVARQGPDLCPPIVRGPSNERTHQP